MKWETPSKGLILKTHTLTYGPVVDSWTGARVVFAWILTLDSIL